MKIFVSYLDVHETVTSEEDFNNQVEKMTHSVDSCRAFSLITPIVVQWASDQSGHGDSNKGYA